MSVLVAIAVVVVAVDEVVFAADEEYKKDSNCDENENENSSIPATMMTTIRIERAIVSRVGGINISLKKKK